MQLNWSTFLLEIINFLVLVWILKRFLYQPVLDVIARRRAGIEEVLADAQQKQQAAEDLRIRYEGRLAEWKAERRAAREKLAEELQAERSRRLEELQVTLAEEREKARLVDERHQADAGRRIEEAALQQAARFASRLLGAVAGLETHEQLLELLLGQLAQLAPEQRAALRNGFVSGPAEALVSSAFPLSAGQRRQLKAAIESIHGDVPVSFEQDAQLIAGVRIAIGAWTLGANLQDELRGFVAAAHEK